LQADIKVAEVSATARSPGHGVRARRGARLPSEAVNAVIQFDRVAIGQKGAPSKAARDYASGILKGQEFSQTGRIVKVR
jgi:hypothetical protein